MGHLWGSYGALKGTYGAAGYGVVMRHFWGSYGALMGLPHTIYRAVSGGSDRGWRALKLLVLLYLGQLWGSYGAGGSEALMGHLWGSYGALKGTYGAAGYGVVMRHFWGTYGAAPHIYRAGSGRCSGGWRPLKLLALLYLGQLWGSYGAAMGQVVLRHLWGCPTHL